MQASLPISILATFIPALTYYLSSRRKLCLRIFSDRDSIKRHMKALPRDPEFRVGMRWIALFQLLFVISFIVASIMPRE